MSEKLEYIEHYAGEMDEETKIQRCIFCGLVIADLSCVMSPDPDFKPKPWSIGSIYVRKQGIRTQTVKLELIPDNWNVIKCI